MRSSRTGEYQEYTQKSSRGGKAALVIVVIAALFIAASAFAGKWLSDNVISPVAKVFAGESAEASASPAASGESLSDAIEVASRSYYLLQSGTFTDEANALTEAQAMKGRGGAGYVYPDSGRSRVILCAYTGEEDAKAVRDALLAEQQLDTYVYTVTTQEFSVTLTASESQVATAKDAFAVAPYAIETLTAISEDYDRGADVTEDMKNLKQKTAEVAVAAKSEMGASGNMTVGSLVEYVQKLADRIAGLPDDLSAKTTEGSAELKYACVELVASWQDFVESLK